MSERFKYSLNGVYRCENFTQLLAANNFPSVPIGSAGGFNDWYIKLKTDVTNEKLVYPFVKSTFNKGLSVKFFFCVLKRDGSTAFFRPTSTYLKMGEGPRGRDMNVLELLNEKNGYLNDGALMIEYGLQVESILEEDNIWRFNTIDPVFECEEKKNMISFGGPNYGHSPDFYAHKQLLTFHSPYFYEKCETTEGNFEEFVESYRLTYNRNNFIEIAHGVHLKEAISDFMDLGGVLSFAYTYSFKNVIRYCERQFIENDMIIGHNINNWKQWVIHWDGLRHYLVHLLKNMKSPRELIKKKDIKTMRGETMKVFIAKFLYNKF